MGKKTKSKQRLDQYYHFAKTQGYRSRAAYKLIQLNRKYNFLSNASAVIDLCAAPGGWMQVCANTMPPNSTIIGVDLDQIKRVPGTISFKGDITKAQTYQRLRKQLKGRKCDAVLNDGAPNVGANWNKDAYTQSQLVLAAFKLATDFLKPGGYFITKVFRSNDTNSLMWVFKKFFEKVEMTKPKASRFASAQTFVVGVNFNAPNFIDQRYFDPTHVFKDTQADHFQQQMAGQITSIDKLLQNRRHRSGYADNTPMHMYKQTTLTNFIHSPNPLLTFAEFNAIKVTPEERQKFYGLSKKIPKDVDQLLKDLKALGKRQISGLLNWRGKLKEILYKQKINLQKDLKKQQKSKNQQDSDLQNQLNDQQMSNSSEQLEKQMLNKKRKQLKDLKQKQQKRAEMLIKAQAANQQLHQDQQFGEQRFQNIIDKDQDIQDIQYVQPQNNDQSLQKKGRKSQYADFSAKQLQQNLQQMYEMKQKRKQEKIEHAKDVQRQKKQRRQQRSMNASNKLKSKRFAVEQQQNQQNQNQEQKENNKKAQNDFEQFRFKNPLTNFDDQDLYISQNQESENGEQNVDPDQKIEGQVSDDDAYKIPKPLTDMQKRRKKLKKTQQKKKKKLHKNIQQGEDVDGQIQIVKQKTIDDYDIDALAQTLVIAKKMLRNHSRQEIIDQSYRGFTFQDHDDLPKWFAQDQKRHNFKKLPITKQQFKNQKDRLMAINARVPKKILQAKVRRKIRIQKKLKHTQKKAENVMSQEGITEVSKLRQIGKLYDKSKRELKDKKKYVVGKKTKAVGGKDSRKVKHVDNRLKKDKRAEKRISKSRHVNRRHKRKGKF